MGALLRRLDAWQRTRSWAGFPFAVVKKFGEDQAGNLAALVAYYAFFSVFPLMLAFATILGFALHGHPDWARTIEHSAFSQLPLISDKNQPAPLKGNIGALVVGLALALWSGLAVDVREEHRHRCRDAVVVLPAGSGRAAVGGGQRGAAVRPVAARDDRSARDGGRLPHLRGLCRARALPPRGGRRHRVRRPAQPDRQADRPGRCDTGQASSGRRAAAGYAGADNYDGRPVSL